MKTFSVLNGYEVKDKNARDAIAFFNNTAEYVVPQSFGAKADGTTDDREAIQNCLNSGKDVFFPAGNYLIKDGLTVNYDYQKIVFDSNAVITAQETDSAAAFIVKSKYNELHNVNIAYEYYSKNVNARAVKIGNSGDEGLGCHLYNIIVTGNSAYGIEVVAKNVYMYGGNISGAKDGIYINATGFYGENICTNQCTRDGFVSVAEYMELHNVYSCNNARYGFNLSNVGFSNFYGIFAEKNIGNGVYIHDTTKEVNIFGGNGQFSGFQKTDKKAYDWDIRSMKKLNMFGCSSTYGPDGKAASFYVINSIAYMYGCSADLAPVIATGSNLCKFINCHNELKKHNTGLNMYRGDVKANIRHAYPTAKVKVYFDEKYNGDDILAFECSILYANPHNIADTGIEKYILLLSGTSQTFIPVTTDANCELNTISAYVYNAGCDDLSYVELTVKNLTAGTLKLDYNATVTLTKISSWN